MNSKQKLLIEYMITDADLFIRCRNILKASFFDKECAKIVDYIIKYSEKYNQVPTSRQIEADLNCQLQPIENITPQQTEWFLNEIERFCKQRAIEFAIFDSVDLLKENNFGKIEQLIKDAVLITLTKSFGTDYYEDPRSRLQRMIDKNKIISTGWTALDKTLYGGFNRGELNIFAGGSGSGKSLFLQNIARYWSVVEGLNVLYLSLELSEELVAFRLDAMNTKLPTKEIFKNLDIIEAKLGMLSKQAGELQIVYMPAGSTTNDIKALLKEFEIQKGITFDAIILDYLDLMSPNNNKVDPGNLFVKDKYVSEELRSMVNEKNKEKFLVTASQLNRSAISKEIEKYGHDHSHIAGGLSKINTADNVITIYTDDVLKSKNEIRLQMIKTRSSSGVGQKIFLNFCNKSLLISNSIGERDFDDGPDDTELINPNDKIKSLVNKRTDIMNRHKQPAVVSVTENPPPVINPPKEKDEPQPILSKPKSNNYIEDMKDIPDLLDY